MRDASVTAPRTEDRHYSRMKCELTVRLSYYDTLQWTDYTRAGQERGKAGRGATRLRATPKRNIYTRDSTATGDDHTVTQDAAGTAPLSSEAGLGRGEGRGEGCAGEDGPAAGVLSGRGEGEGRKRKEVRAKRKR